MRLDRFTSKFQIAISDAQSLALGRDHQFIEPVHLMTALLNQQGSSLRGLFEQAGVNVNGLRSALAESIDRLPRVDGVGGDVQLAKGSVVLLNLCDKIAQQRKDDYITSEIFVLAALQDQGNLGQLLADVGATEAKINSAIEQLRGGQKVTDPNAEDVRQALEKYTTDLTERAEQGKLDPVIGRDDEIRRTVQVLQRRTKNNPVLIGEPGV
ncbi:MAG: Clp protease N-terminal domain-containing protein, partial [Alteromonas sp.]